jgi:large subunit ribosomal protein L4
MATCKIYRFAAGEAADHEVDASSFGVRAPRRVQREAVLMYKANQRAGTHDTLDRSEVSFTKRKPWKQKHTGRARSGKKSSPIWRGGGVAHGPHPRDYSYGVPRKALRAATRAAVAGKFLDGEVAFIDALELDAPSTSRMASILRALGVDRSFLLVLPERDESVYKSARNIAGARILPACEVNAYEVLRRRHLVLVGDALERLLERLGPAQPAGADAGEEPR